MSEVLSWAEFEREAPELAAAGRRLLVGDDGVAIGFLATRSSGGLATRSSGGLATRSGSAALHLSPVCPIFCGDDLYLSAGGHTPKARDLRDAGAYVLHAFLGENDEEFQVGGRALAVTDEEERAAVHEAIPFAAFDGSDPIFRLSVERSLRVYWERVGQPDTRAVRARWSAGTGG